MTGNHGNNTAYFVGDRSCKDGQSDPNISGRIPSDSEVHENPGVSGFVTATGSAPDYYRVHGTGSLFCTNQVVMTLQMTGATYPACYHLHIDTNKNSYDCDTNASGACSINATGNSQWDDDTDLFFIFSKRNIAGCQAAQRDNPTYTVKGHL